MTDPDHDVRRALERLQHLFERARDLECERAPLDTDRALREPVIDLCAALVRLRIAPVFSNAAGGTDGALAAARAWLAHDPVHLTVLGSTNTGKSTVLNVLLGRAASGMRVTARFSQHPEAWANAEFVAHMSDYPGRFAGYAVYVGEPAPRQEDPDLAARGWRPALSVRDPTSAPRAVDHGSSSEGEGTSCAAGAVLWDAPDVSTEEAQAWLPAVVDTLALAEVVLYVVTNESYADDRGLLLFELARKTAAGVEVCANKVGAASRLVADIQTKLAKGSGPLPGVHPLPWVAGADPAQRLAAILSTPEATALRSLLGRRLAQGGALKLSALERSVRFLEASFERALEPLKSEARVADRWAAIVRRTTVSELSAAYSAEYLESRRYQEFKDALVELMRLLEVPGLGRVLSGLGRVARMPFGLVKRAWSSMSGLGDSGAQGRAEDEHRVVARLFRSWLAALKAEAQTLARAERHPAWTRIADRVAEPAFVDELVRAFEEAYRAYRGEVEQKVSESARAIHAKIAESPKLLNSLRAANLVGDASVTISAVASGGLSPTDLLLGPLVHGLWEELIERGLGGFVRRQEELLKRWQEERVGALFHEELGVRARALFVGAFDPAELDQGARDLALLRRATDDVLAGLREEAASSITARGPLREMEKR